jgi:hypothetical protein
MEVSHNAHAAPEKAGQLVHAAEPVVLLYVPALHGAHTPPFAPL